MKASYRATSDLHICMSILSDPELEAVRVEAYLRRRENEHEEREPKQPGHQRHQPLFTRMARWLDPSVAVDFSRRRTYDGPSHVPDHSHSHDISSLETSSSRAPEAEMPHSKPHSKPDSKPQFNEQSLLELCDSVRASLAKTKTLGTRAHEIMDFLQRVWQNESDGRPGLDLETVRRARLDKLLVDMLSGDNRPSPTPIQFRADMATADGLQRLWRSRFRAKYFELDQVRYLALTRTGRLRGVVYNSGAEDGSNYWQTTVFKELSELESDMRFEPGSWWLNLACAYRDGVVGTTVETPTRGKYGVAALPLMTGREELHWPGGTVRYMREGRLADMHVSLISQVGSQLRILRGHCLKSPQAPKAGVRYDGLYIIRSYSQRRNQQTEMHQMVLTLERVKAQRPVQEVVKIPRPSQLDDWQLYEKHEGEMVKRTAGDRGFLDWKMNKAQERLDLEQWRRTMHLGLELNLARLSREKDKASPAVSSLTQSRASERAL